MEILALIVVLFAVLWVAGRYYVQRLPTRRRQSTEEDATTVVPTFSESDLELLALIGNQAGVAIHQARLKEDVQEFFYSTVRMIATAIDKKDGYTDAHSVRVGALARMIAAELGEETITAELEDSENILDLIEFAGLLHDIGKIATPDHILNKPGKLSAEEFEKIKEHPVHGEEILREAETPRIKAILPAIRHHHEHWDGGGYPDGLLGEETPVAARIIHVAEAVDAMLSDAPYRPALSVEQVASVLRRFSGKQFDPDMVEKFLESSLLERAAQRADSANAT